MRGPASRFDQTHSRAPARRSVHTLPLVAWRTWPRTALWEYEARHNGKLPYAGAAAAELENIASGLLAQAGVNRQALPAVPRELIECVTPPCP